MPEKIRYYSIIHAYFIADTVSISVVMNIDINEETNTFFPSKSDVIDNVSSDTPTFFEAQCLHFPLVAVSRFKILENINQTISK